MIIILMQVVDGVYHLEFIPNSLVFDDFLELFHLRNSDLTLMQTDVLLYR